MQSEGCRYSVGLVRSSFNESRSGVILLAKGHEDGYNLSSSCALKHQFGDEREPRVRF